MNSTAKPSIPVLPEYDYLSLYPYTKRISSSQFLSYEKDPAKFYLENVLGVRRESTPAMKLGSIFSASYADRTFDFKTLLEHLGYKFSLIETFGNILKRFPVLKGGHPEYPMIAEFNGWEFRASLDDYVEDTLTIVENKTGKVPWTQERANHDDQMTFQNWCHWKKKGIVARKTLLNWWNTGSKTPDLKSFKTSRSLANLRQFEKRVENVIKNIEAGNFTNPIY